MNKKRRPFVVLCVCIVMFLVYNVIGGMNEDNTPPKITVSGDSAEILEVSMADMQMSVLRDVTALDGHDGDVTDSLLVEQIGNITDDNHAQVVYAAFDSAGNVSKLRRTVRITDYRAPRFVLTSPLNFVYNTNFDPLKFVGAEDVLDGDIRHRVKATLMDETSITAEGIHNVQFRVTNSLGDTVQLVLPVEVYYAGRYDAQLFLSDYLVYLPVGAHLDPEDYLYEFLAYGQAVDLTKSIPESLTLTITGDADTDKPGVYSVAYTVSSTRGTQTSHGYTRLIVVVEG